MPNTRSVVRPKWKFFPRQIYHARPIGEATRARRGWPRERKRVREHGPEREPRSFRRSRNKHPVFFGSQGIESLRSHDHHLARPVSLGNFEMGVVAGCPKVSWRRSDCSHPADERGLRIESPETPDHFLVQFVGEVEDVSGVGIENENDVHSKMIGAPGHPLQHPLEAAPVREPIFERKQSGYAQPRSGSAIKQLLFAGFGPSGVAPRSGRRKFGWIGNHHVIIYGFSTER